MRTVRDLRLGDLGRGAAELQDDVGDEALEVGQNEQVGAVSRCDGAEVLQAVPGSGAERRADERVFG